MNRKKITLAVTAALSAAILCLFALFCYSRTEAFQEKAAAMVQEKAADILGTKAEISKVSLASWNTVSLQHPAVYGKDGRKIAEAESAEVHFSLFSVLKNPGAAAVDEIRVHKAQAELIRHTDGSWNYEELLTDSGEESSFRGKVILEDGSLAAVVQGKEIRAAELNGSADFASAPACKFEIKGKIDGSAVEAAGVYGGEEKQLSIKASELDLTPYLDLLPADLLPENLVLKGGKLEQADLVVTKKDNWDIAGKVTVSGGKAEIEGIEVTEIAGQGDFSGQSASFTAAAVAEGQRAAVHGRVYFDLPEPHFDLLVESNGFAPEKIFPQSPFQGKLAFKVRLTGTAAEPYADGHISLAEGTISGYALKNVKADVLYDGQGIFVRNLQADALAGHVSGDVDFAVESKQYEARLQLNRLQLGYLQELLPDVSGSLSGDLTIMGSGNDWSRLKVMGSASAENVSYKGLALNTLNCSFKTEGDDVVIDAAAAKVQNGGTLGLKGKITKGRNLQLEFRGTHFDLSLLQAVSDKADLTGLADFSGTVNGDSANPQVTLYFAAHHGSLFKQPFHTLHGSASGSLDGIGIDSFYMENDGHETWRVQGTVGFTGEKRINLRVDTMGARMEDIAALVAPDQPLTGNVDNVIQFTGTLDHIDAVGYIHFYRGSYRGVLLSGMDGDYTIKDNVMTVQDFHIFSPMVDMVLNGTVDRALNLNLQVAAKYIDIKRFEHKLPYPASGQGSFYGSVGGSLDRPLFDGRLAIPELVINGETLTEAKGDVSYRGSILHFDDFGFKHNGGSMMLDLNVNLATNNLAGTLELANVDVNGLASLVNLKNDVFHGRMAGRADIGGKTDNPAVHLTGSMPSGDINGYPLSNILVDINLFNKEIFINQCQGNQGDGIVAAAGTVSLEGPLNLQCSAQGIDAGIPWSFLGVTSDKLKGTLAMDLQVSGTYQNPEANLSVLLTNGGLRAAAFDKATGLFNLRNGIINVNQCRLEKTVADVPYSINVYGKVPLAALRDNEGADGQDKLDLTIDVDDADLSMLSALSDQLEWSVGPTDGKIKISGTVAQPAVDGTFRVVDGAVKFKAVKTPLENINVKADFIGKRFELKEFSGSIGGGKFNLSGQTLFEGTKPQQYDFQLTADNLWLESDFYTGSINGAFTLQEGTFYKFVMPKLSGNLLLDDALITIPSLPEGESNLPNMLLDVKLDLGKKVRLYNSQFFDMWLAGGAHFGGMTRYPNTSGAITVKRGTVSYLKNRFNIDEGTAYFNQVNSFLPSITLRASTKLEQTNVFLAVDGPASQMVPHLTSSPAMSETEILKLLTLRSAYRGSNADDSQLNDMLTVGLKMSFLSEVEGLMRDFLSLDEFEVGRDTTSINSKNNSDNSTKEVYNVKMGKYVTDKLMLRYTKGIGADTNRYDVQYDLNDRMSVSIGRDTDKGNIVGLQARFSF